MTTILLARHARHAEVGAVLSGRSEIALSEVGRAEAVRLGEHLAAVPLAAIHTSPRRRTRETAEAVAAGRTLPVFAVDALDEIDFGAWAGQTFAALDADPAWHRWNTARGSAGTPGGEDMATATRRAVAHVDGLAGQEGTILCVSHCDIIRGIVAHYLGLEADRLLNFDIDPASLTTLDIWPGGGRVIAVNERTA